MHPRLLCLTFLILSIGCSKNNHSCDPARMGTMTGKWKLTVSTGGFAGQTIYPPIGSDYTLTLNSDSTYQRHINGLNDTGTFTIIPKNSDPASNSIPGPAIVFSKNPSLPVTYYLGMDSLVLSDNISDGYTSVYRRVH
jgi:hypothetical protein